MPGVITLSVFMLSVFYAECLLCLLSFMLSVFYARCHDLVHYAIFATSSNIKICEILLICLDQRATEVVLQKLIIM
jgi:hypothetical protein